MKNAKKLVKYFITVVVVVIVIAVSTVAILKILNNTASNSNTQTNVVPTNETADALIVSAASTNDAAKAKELLLQARQQYVDINDQDHVNAVDAEIKMIDNVLKK